MTEVNVIEPDVTLNLVGVTCPGPIVSSKKMIDELGEGKILLLVSNCPGTEDDLYAWAHNTGNAVLKVERYADGSTGFFIQRGAPAHRSANVVLDMRGSVCPGPILEARKLLHGMAAGEVLRLVSNCPGSRDDVADWTRETGLELIETVKTGVHEYEFYIRKPLADAR